MHHPIQIIIQSFIRSIIQYIRILIHPFLFLYDQPIQKVYTSPEKEFYQKELRKFQMYEESIAVDPCTKNQNVEAFYYDLKKYTEIFQEPNNEHELKWKRRILYMTTPLGNVAMYYDPYKMGFAYYADQYIRYDILNAVAMHYVKIYKCIDFFMDENIVKQSFQLIDLHKKEIVKQQQSNRSNAFVKYKSIKTPIIFVSNTFISMGKMNNIAFLQSRKTGIKQLPKFTSNLLQNIEIQANTQKERISYKDFKESICCK